MIKYFIFIVIIFLIYIFNIIYLDIYYNKNKLYLKSIIKNKYINEYDNIKKKKVRIDLSKNKIIYI